MKEVNTQEYLTILHRLVEEGHEVCVPISGSSMTPFLAHERDTVCFQTPDRPLRAGDMVFFQRRTGQYIMHRICRIKKDGYYIVGDAQSDVEGPIAREQIFGLVTRARRKGRWIGPGDFWWEFFARVWRRIVPLRRIVLYLYPHRRKD